MVQYKPALDVTFAALADPTRRGILTRLVRQDASISDLACEFGMTLTGVTKHVRVLEAAGFVVTEKAGRIRTCRIGPRGLEAESAWIAEYQRLLNTRLGG